MSNLDIKEIEHFQKDSDYWWNPEGPFKPLHKLNSVRIEYIRDTILKHFQKDTIDNLSIIDVGCGGGLVCEPFARQGAKVTGLDADVNAIAVAKEHAAQSDLKIDYQAKLIEDVIKKYDVVLALEVIEHVPSVEAFIENCLNICKDDGVVIFSTLNRTAKSYALGIVAAEYILNWVPKGTHHWKKFVKPSEIARVLRKNEARVKEINGLVYKPLSDKFSINPNDVDVNYFLVAGKDTSASRK